MIRPDSSAVVSVEVLVKQNIVLEIRIVLKFLRSSEDRTLTIAIAEEQMRKALRQLLGDLQELKQFKLTQKIW